MDSYRFKGNFTLRAETYSDVCGNTEFYATEYHSSVFLIVRCLVWSILAPRAFHIAASLSAVDCHGICVTSGFFQLREMKVPVIVWVYNFFTPDLRLQN